ncbi:MAG TPA: protein kinase [Kofleriaceae bacterium]|nr:protein kinase [Kofleriaceae bacterium]
MPLLEGDLEHYPRKFGKYHLLSPLAQGGMGMLNLAVGGDRGLERLMVIKRVLPHLADAEYVARFRDEAKVVVKLSHGNLIPVFDAGVVGGELFIAMDFVEGRDLRAVWNRCAKKQVAFPIDVAVYIVKELCRGLAYAHSFPDLHLVHRDISPPNILVSYTGEVRLTDFGLASSTLKLEKTAPGIIYGKVAYMSPEQARGEKLDGRSDMYAAAIVLWELLTGRQMFPPGKDQPQDLLVRAKNPEPMRPSKRAPRVPVELDEICVRALAAGKEDRYADCDAMRTALQAWLAQNAPTTDGTRMATFLLELFADDIQRERVEREELLSRFRNRALTLPPTDELRQMVENGGRPVTSSEPTVGHEAPVRKPGSVGRRATDLQEAATDRRQSPDRRSLPTKPLVTDHSSSAVALAQELVLEESEPDLLGAEIDGRYRVLDLIGEGGMGKVYLAEHIEIGKRVALKVLHPSYSRMPDLVERFRREARAASKIGHPNIVDVTDSGTTADGSVYFVMEYLEGVELGSVIEREGALDVARALKITGQICRALAAAHREGIIHRDLKPENIFLVTRDGTADVVKVLDFGIAKTTEAEAARERRLTSPGMAMGTPEYMAPEQAAGRPADARCDVYAVGAILYEMVTGVPPYSGDNFMEILTKKATVDPPPPIQVRGEIASQVSDVVTGAMARSPDDRPQTMEALEYELNKCLAGRGVAVAQILGMTTDPHVVATLNPGLSMRQFDDAVVVSRAQTSSPAIGLTRAGTHGGMNELPGMFSGPTITSGQVALARQGTDSAGGSHPGQSYPGQSYPGQSHPGQSYPGQSMQLRAQSSPSISVPSAPSAYAPSMSDPNLSLVPQPVGSVRSSALGVFGWLVLAAVLFGGVGALLYVALGERTAATKVGEVAPVTGGAGQELGSKAGPPTAESAPSAHGSGASAGRDPVNQDPDAVTGSGGTDDDPRSDPARPDGRKPGDDRSHKRTPSRVAMTNKRPAPAADDKDPRSAATLEKQAIAFEKANKWSDARAVYKKLEKVKSYPRGKALYGQAMAAFQLKATSDAMDLAKAAAAVQSGHDKAQALMLYGDALYLQGEHARAKNVYVLQRKNLTGDEWSEATRKIALCNRALKLPDGDVTSSPSGN